jgi:pSer/pThr/pTyr-binding forkhead associated (FHA) protein/cytoskeletal protein RodZ
VGFVFGQVTFAQASKIMFKLTIVDDEGRNTVVPLPSGRDEFTIGRKDGNTIKLTEQNVSRQHARLVRANGSFYIEDKGSYTGVKVNGDRITGRRHIKEGDEIRIGDYHLSLSIEKQIEKEPKNGASKGLTSGTAVITLDKKQQERLRAGEKTTSERGRLCLLSGPLAGKLYPIERDEVVIGRTDDNDIVLNHRSISRNHAKIVVTNNVHQIVDLGSANGVRVNGEEYGKIDLRKGDKIDLGHVRLRFVGAGEDFAYDPSMKEDVVGADDSGKGGAGLWIALAAVLVVVGLGGAFAMGFIGGPDKITPPPTNPQNTTQASNLSTPNTPPTNPPPGDEKAALLKQAEEAAAKEDFTKAAELAKQAGDDALSALYYNEDNAKNFLPICKEAIDKNETDNIFNYCYEALKESTETKMYKKGQATIDQAKAKYKEGAIADVKASLDRVDAVVKANNAAQLGAAKSQLNSSKEKLDNLTKFVGSDGDISTLQTRASELVIKLKDVKPDCDENACAKKNGTCNASTGVCVVEKPKCDLSACPDGCEKDNKTCKKPKPDPTKCDEAACKAKGGTCNASTGACDAGTAVTPVSTIDVESVRSKLAGADGCGTVTKEEWDVLKKSSNSDYLFFKGYCASDANPGKACEFWVKFVKSNPGDARAGRARTFIQSNQGADYPECQMP